MATITIQPCTFTLLILLLLLLLHRHAHALVASTSVAHAKQVYIAYLGHTGGLEPEAIEADHHNMLISATGSKDVAESALIYNYKYSFRGFAAKLSEDEASIISRMPGVVSVFRSKSRNLQTTRSWQFLGVEKDTSFGSSGQSNEDDLWQRAKFGENVIVGLLDTGIWPESESFQDESLPSIPEKWKGICEKGVEFNASLCNRKLIGARMYVKGHEQSYGPLNVTATGEYLSCRDRSGHGSHTSSTAAGDFVQNVSTFGFGSGIAKGGAPRARIAMYKTCWPIPGGDPIEDSRCVDVDVMAAFDDGIHDGVDIFSISIGYANPQPTYSQDVIAIGAFHAMLKGIPVFCAGGNFGPTPATVSNVSPWIITVAASTIDRKFPSPTILGDGTILKGESISPEKLADQFYPLVFAGTTGIDSKDASQCLPNSLDPAKVKGKVVLCMRGLGTRVGKSQEVLNAGGIGFILGNLPANGSEVAVDAYALPGTAINAADAITAQNYIKFSRNPQVKILPASTVVGIKPAPVIPAFSSRGPNSLTAQILKPDIAAPGVNILAAWTQGNSPIDIPSDHRRTAYNIISGTSMACPHAAGIGALIKSIHPTWSTAAIKSAIMTTAKVVNDLDQPITNASGNEAGPFEYGAGEINPVAAADPGLVYDAKPKDYLLFLCKIGLNNSEIHLMTGLYFSCGPKPPRINNLNYPSVAIANLKHVQIIKRTVTNVGPEGSTYNVTVQAPPGIYVDINPKSLHFRAQGEKRKFKILFRVLQPSKRMSVFGSYTWSDGSHVVRSPIVVETR